MAALAGLLLALLVAALARLVGFDRDKAFYPIILIVIASYYVLFAVIAGDCAGVAIELAFFLLFAGVAILGFRFSLWAVVAGLVLHGLFDAARDILLWGNGIPTWWPGMCLAYDLSAALGLAAILLLIDGRAVCRREDG